MERFGHFAIRRTPFGARAGFALLEVLLFLAAAIVAIGIAMVPAGRKQRIHLTDRAIAQMNTIQAAITTYFRDIEAYPPTLDNLATNVSGASPWMGPYVQRTFTDREAAGDGWKIDPWRTPYALVVTSPTTRQIRSYGRNRIDNGGSGDDLVLDVDSNPILWVVTKLEMRMVNNAITTYNATEAPPWLSLEYTAALNKLEAKGLLPPGSAPKFRYRYDAWGQWYFTVGNPPTAAGTLGPP